MGDRNGASFGGRVALVLLTFDALAIIAPDFLRVVRPLGSFGLAADGDGLIYDVQGPFATEEASPEASFRPSSSMDRSVSMAVTRGCGERQSWFPPWPGHWPGPCRH